MFCYELLKKTFDLPSLCLEIANRVKEPPKYGIHESVLNSVKYDGTTVSVEFKTNTGRFISYKFRIDNFYSEKELFETLAVLKSPTTKLDDLPTIPELLKTNRYNVFFGLDSDGYEKMVVLGRLA